MEKAYFSIFQWGTNLGNEPEYLFYTGPSIGPQYPFTDVSSLTAYEIGQVLGGN